MKKEKINGRFVVTQTAEDFTDEFVGFDEVDFADMKNFAENAKTSYEKQGKRNVNLELFQEDRKFVISWDLSI